MQTDECHRVSWNQEHNGQEYAENSKCAKYAEFAKYTKYAKYAEFAKYTKYAENVMLIWTDHVSKRDFPFIEPANIKLILWRSSCQRWPAAARQETTWWRRSLPWQLRVVTFNQKVQKLFSFADLFNVLVVSVGPEEALRRTMTYENHPKPPIHPIHPSIQKPLNVL